MFDYKTIYMKRILLLSLVFAITTSFAQTSKEKDIKRLLELTGSGDLGMQVLDKMISSFSEAYPNVPAAFWKEFQNEISPDALENMVIPIYAKYYNEKEIKELIAFYESPIGKKVLKTTPLVMDESMNAGRKWGESLGEKIALKMQVNGYIK